MITLLDATRDPNLFAPWFRKRETWQSWFAFIAALFGEKLTDEQLAIYRQCTGREVPPSTVAQEAWLVIGRRGGKRFILGLIATYLACFFEYRQYLQPGDRGTVLVLAATAKQARVIFRFIRGLLTEVPLLKAMVERETVDSFDLTNGVSIEVNAASYRSVRGYSVLAALCDETAFWSTDEASAEPDVEVLNAIRPAMSTIPNSMLLCASSPYARKGALFEAYRRHHGQEGDPVMLWRAPTRTMNPSVPQSLIDAATDRDPAHAAAEYGAQFREDIESYVKLDVVERCVAVGVTERPPRSGTYKSFIDPSGGANDSMTLAVAHREGELVVIDKLMERKPPFSPAAVVKEFAAVLRKYRISKVCGDRYAGEWPREVFRQHGITYEPSAKPKNDLYIALLPLLSSQTIELVDQPRLISQIAGLERRTARGGRDSIDHPPNGHDDLANAIAGVAAMLSKTSTYDLSKWFPADEPLDLARQQQLAFNRYVMRGGW